MYIVAALLLITVSANVFISAPDSRAIGALYKFSIHSCIRVAQGMCSQAAALVSLLVTLAAVQFTQRSTSGGASFRAKGCNPPPQSTLLTTPHDSFNE